MSVLRLDDVTKRYGDAVALDGLSLCVNVGEIVALVGPNGAGKTTLTRIAAALLAPDEGAVTVAGVDARAHPAAARRNLALVPQGAAPDLTVTPWEHIYYYLRARDLSRSAARHRADQVLTLLGLDEQRDKPTHRLSGGYQRRVLIAMCLAAQARLLLLDEPTTALDPQMRRQTWELLDELRPSSAVLVTTHDMAEAETIADRIVLLAQGRVAAIGTAKQLIAALPADLKIVVDAASDELRLPGACPQRVGGRAVLLPGEPGQLRDWVARLTDAGVAFSVEPCRLEDAYFHLLGEIAA